MLTFSAPASPDDTRALLALLMPQQPPARSITVETYHERPVVLVTGTRPAGRRPLHWRRELRLASWLRRRQRRDGKPARVERESCVLYGWLDEIIWLDDDTLSVTLAPRGQS